MYPCAFFDKRNLFDYSTCLHIASYSMSAYAYIHTCQLIWPAGVVKYKDALGLIRTYLNRIDLWMIGRTCTCMPLPLAPLSAAQLAHFNVMTPDYFPFAVRTNDIGAMEWLFERGLFDRLDTTMIPMRPETYRWLLVHEVPTQHPHSLWNHTTSTTNQDLMYVCLRKDAMECYLAFDQQLKYKCAMMACIVPCLDIVKLHYMQHHDSIPDFRGMRLHPDAVDLLHRMHPNVQFHCTQCFRTDTAKRIHAIMPRKSTQWMWSLTWDESAAAWMDMLPIEHADMQYVPICDRAVQWCIKHGIKFAELDALPYWNNPPMRLFRHDLMKNMSMGASKRTCHAAIWHLTRDRVGHRTLMRLLNAHVHLPFAREDIDTLSQHADGALMSRVVPVFTKTHLVAALRAGNIPFLRWLVGIACQHGVEYCVRHVKHKRTWIWLRDNTPPRPYLTVSFSDNIDQHLREQLRADGVTFFRRVRS